MSDRANMHYWVHTIFYHTHNRRQKIPLMSYFSIRVLYLIVTVRSCFAEDRQEELEVLFLGFYLVHWNPWHTLLSEDLVGDLILQKISLNTMGNLDPFFEFPGHFCSQPNSFESLFATKIFQQLWYLNPRCQLVFHLELQQLTCKRILNVWFKRIL